MPPDEQPGGGGDLPPPPETRAAPPGPRPDPTAPVTRGFDVRMAPESVNESERTVEMMCSTGVAVRRYDWNRERYYDEVLVVTPEAVDLSRFDSGAPLLDSHMRWSVDSVLGRVMPGSARIVNGQLLATAQVSAREAVAGAWQDIKSGILRGLSVGYIVQRYEMDETTTPPTYRVTRWLPYEVSVVPVPAEAGAGFRSLPPAGQSPATMETRMPPEELQPGGQPPATPDANRNQPAPPSTPAGEQTRALPPAPPPGADPVAAERSRAAEITALCMRHAVPADVMQRFLSEGVSPDTASRQILDRLAERSEQNQTRTQVQMGDLDETVTRRDAAVEAILHRALPSQFQLTERAMEFRGLRLIEIARKAVEWSGVNTRGMVPDELARHALNCHRDSYRLHTASDFPIIADSVIRRVLRKSYEAQASAWRLFSRQRTAVDFRQIQTWQVSGMPQLLKVGEDGEIERGSLAMSKESFALATYARIIGVTRQTLINDDMDVFGRLPMTYGASVARMEANVVWSVFLRNPTMKADGNPLFHPDHKNVAETGTAPTPDTLSDGFTAMGTQTGIDGDGEGDVLGLEPKFLICSIARRAAAERAVGKTVQPTRAQDAVPSFLQNMTVIPEARIDRLGANTWFLAADPNSGGIDTIEYAYLEGQESGPFVESREGFDVDGMEVKVREDFGAGAVDWRGFYMNPGAAPAAPAPETP